MARNKQHDDSPRPAWQTWPRWARVVVSLLVLFHLTALVVGPMAVPPSSILMTRAWDVFQPYLEAAYLNHGYHFFAPEPGPSHLVHYELEMPDGSRREGVFPNLDEHWPRLLYHRHFMLSERLAAAPPETEWIQRYSESYARHLLVRHGAKRVSLTLRRHLLPYPDQVQDGMKLTDPRLYEERSLGEFESEGS